MSTLRRQAQHWEAYMFAHLSELYDRDDPKTLGVTPEIGFKTQIKMFEMFKMFQEQSRIREKLIV